MKCFTPFAALVASLAFVLPAPALACDGQEEGEGQLRPHWEQLLEESDDDSDGELFTLIEEEEGDDEGQLLCDSETCDGDDEAAYGLNEDSDDDSDEDGQLLRPALEELEESDDDSDNDSDE